MTAAGSGVPARRNHRPDAGKLFRRKHLSRRFARGIHQLKALADPHHHGLGEPRIDQDFEWHGLSS
jgi:hypothetical protein